MNNLKNILNCNSEEGICEMPNSFSKTSISKPLETSEILKIIYFTDPICSSCWGVEPQLRKLKLRYGKNLHIDYRMGGLLPDWSYNSGGISKPSDVAIHWDEASLYYQMPIDGDVWLENPLHSSFPPSIAFKAVQRQSEQKAICFLRIIREFVFLEKKNIGEWQHIVVAAKLVDIDIQQFKIDFQNIAKQDFQNDLILAQKMSVKGFPTFFILKEDKVELIYGAKPYDIFEKKIENLSPNLPKYELPKNVSACFDFYPSFTLQELFIILGLPKEDIKKEIQLLLQLEKITSFNTKNGYLWRSNS